MKSSPSLVRFVVPMLVVLPVGYKAVGWIRPQAKPAYVEASSQIGRDLFLHEWKPNDPLASLGDGLGPVFNAASCVACHRQGGAGGGGPLENNVTAFTVQPKHDHAARQGVVHGFAVEACYQETLALVAGGLSNVSRPPLKDVLPNVVSKGCVQPPHIGSAPGVNVSQRNTPALFGAALIDGIPDRAIIQNEKAQQVKWGFADSETEQFPVGRALRLADGRVGKFGWKAQIGTLSDFVRAACANELGLGNPSHAQPASMSRGIPARGLDLTDRQCDELTSFVASLARPIERASDSPELTKAVTSGKQAFHAIGCADCHMQDVGSVKGLYSDLLLHQMGVELSGGGSYGEPAPDLPDVPSGSAPLPGEWRTPPLWGVANSAPYLHDGRASTLEQAIGLHLGQGAKAAGRFAKLTADERSNLLIFLRTLRAPESAEPVPQVADVGADARAELGR